MSLPSSQLLPGCWHSWCRSSRPPIDTRDRCKMTPNFAKISAKRGKVCHLKLP